jgi:hypothetical protein
MSIARHWRSGLRRFVIGRRGLRKAYRFHVLDEHADATAD